MGYFKGIIEIESQDDKAAYLLKKEELINDLKVKVNKISMQ